MWALGIDWAEKHLDYCLLSPPGDVILRGRVDNNESGFAQMLASVQKEAIDFTAVAAAIESPHQPVVDFLITREVAVYPVNPTAIFDYRKSLRPSGSKSDTADAQLIASYLQIHHQQLRVFRLSEPQLRQLKLLVEDRDKLITEKVRLHNQLRSTLLGYYPQAVMAFSDLSTKTALDFLSQFPNPESLKGRTDTQWEEFLNGHHVYHKKARLRFLAAMGHNPLTVDAEVIVAKSLFCQTRVSQLVSLMAALKVYEEQIERTLGHFDDFDRFKSLPGVDVILSAKLLVAIITPRQRFASANELQSLFGTAPYTKSSGQNRSVPERKACHKRMRTTLHQIALCSLRASDWAKAYFAKKRKEGKGGAHALRCLANLWLKVIFAIWKKKTLYNENEHLAAVARHQLAAPI